MIEICAWNEWHSIAITGAMRMKSTMQRVLIVMLVAFLLFPSIGTTLGSEPEIMFCAQVQDYIEHPSDYVCVDVVAGNNNDADIYIQRIDLFREDTNTLLTSIPVDAVLKPLNVPYTTSEFKSAFFSRVELPEDAKTAEDFMSENQGLTYYEMVTIPMDELLDDVRPDQVYRIKGVIVYEMNDKTYEAQDQSGGYYAEAPAFLEEEADLGENMILAVPSGWSRADMHTHSRPSSNDSNSYVDEMIAAANTALGSSTQRKTISFTDHNDQMNLTEWNDRNNEIDGQQSNYPNVTEGKNLELTTSSTNDHMITVGLTSFIPGTNTLSNYISTLNTQGAIGGPAHPAHLLYPWSDADLQTSGMKATELGDSGVPFQGNINDWDLMLKTGINSTVPSGSYEIGLGGSDAHSTTPIGRGVTWLYNVTSSESSIKTAVNSRKVSFALNTHTWSSFSLNSNSTTYAMGVTNGVINGSTITLNIQHEAIGGYTRQITNVRIVKYDTVDNTVRTYDMAPSTSTSTSKSFSSTHSMYPRTNSKGYYRIEVTVIHTAFSGAPEYFGKAYTNPIFFSRGSN